MVGVVEIFVKLFFYVSFSVKFIGEGGGVLKPSSPPGSAVPVYKGYSFTARCMCKL